MIPLPWWARQFEELTLSGYGVFHCHLHSETAWKFGVQGNQIPVQVNDKIERLQRDLELMQCFLGDAENRQHSERVVSVWVAEIRDFAYEAEEVLERYVHNVSHPRQKGWKNTVAWFSCILCDARSLHEVGSSIDDMRTRITELTSRLQLYGLKVSKEKDNMVSNLALKNHRQTYSHTKEEPIGLDKHTELVVAQLVTKDKKGVKYASICGMGGLGKTTLARQVFHHEAIREHFKNKRAWVCVSNQFETRVVFKEILMGLVDFEDKKKLKELRGLTDGQLPQKICGILSETNCLVVLDDLWSNADWDELKSAFEPVKGHGSKILFTSRKSDLIKHVDAGGYCHDPNLFLGKEDSWKLLKRVISKGNNETLFLDPTGQSDKEANIGESSPPANSDTRQASKEVGDMKTMEYLGREMLKHCNGLPLAIVTLGGVLSNKKTISKWKNVQKNIKLHLLGDTEHTNDIKGLFSILELSYKDLPHYLKPCFMYLANFPEDYEIKADRLYHLWEAEGLVTNSEDDIQELYLDDIAESYLYELVKRCLVLVTKFSGSNLANFMMSCEMCALRSARK